MQTDRNTPQISDTPQFSPVRCVSYNKGADRQTGINPPHPPTSLIPPQFSPVTCVHYNKGADRQKHPPTLWYTSVFTCKVCELQQGCRQTDRTPPPPPPPLWYTSISTCNVCVLQEACRQTGRNPPTSLTPPQFSPVICVCYNKGADRHRQKPCPYLSDGLQVALSLGFVQKVPQLLGDAEPLTGVIPNAVDEQERGVGLHSKLLLMRHTGQPQHNTSNSWGITSTETMWQTTNKQSVLTDETHGLTSP